jgi:hypothetical protein
MADAATWRTVVRFRDARGFVGLHTFFTQAANIVAARVHAEAVFTVLEPLTNATREQAWGAYTTPPSNPTPGAQDIYLSVQDRAEMVFTTATGNVARYRIPSPRITIFHIDGVTVDRSNADVAAWASAMVNGGGSSRTGELLVTFQGGRLVRGKSPGKLTGYVLMPTLGGNDW